MIFYFSATGNSKYLAQKLQDITGDEMYDIAAELRGNCGYTLADDEIVYIVSPVYFFGMPLNVKEFIDRMSFNRRPDVDIMINFGTLPGDAIHAFEKELNAKGFNVRNRYCRRELSAEREVGMNMPEHLYFRIERRENARQRLRAEVGVYRIGVILFNYPLKL